MPMIAWAVCSVSPRPPVAGEAAVGWPGAESPEAEELPFGER